MLKWRGTIRKCVSKPFFCLIVKIPVEPGVGICIDRSRSLETSLRPAGEMILTLLPHLRRVLLLSNLSTVSFIFRQQLLRPVCWVRFSQGARFDDTIPKTQSPIVQKRFSPSLASRAREPRLRASLGATRGRRLSNIWHDRRWPRQKILLILGAQGMTSKWPVVASGGRAGQKT